MDYRNTDISQRLNEWLDRLAVPYHLRDKPEAAQKEAETLLRMLLRYAPKGEYVPFVNRVFDQLDSRMKDRKWPTPHDMGAACVNVAKEGGKDAPQSDVDMSPEAIMGRRMAAGEAVGETWLYGRQAVDLIAGNHVTREVMESYRSAAFLSRRNIYGEEEALKWEADAKERHDCARALHKERNAPKGKYDTTVAPNMIEAA